MYLFAISISMSHYEPIIESVWLIVTHTDVRTAHNDSYFWIWMLNLVHGLEGNQIGNLAFFILILWNKKYRK